MHLPSEYFLGLWTQLWPWGPDPHPSALGLSGTACLKQGWVGRALRRWPQAGGCVLLPEDQEVNVDSGTLQGQWDTTLPVTWECLKPVSLLLQTLKTSKSFCLLDYEDEEEEGTTSEDGLVLPV